MKSGFRVYCPNGHCIEVQERHRGRTGRCPRCREVYFVPAGSWDEEKAMQDDEAKKSAAISAALNADDAKARGDQASERTQRVRLVVLFTGGALQNEHAILADLRSRIGHARIVVLGIGNGINRHFFRKLASVGRGFAEFISPAQNITRFVDQVLGRLDRVVLSDIELQTNGCEGFSLLPERCSDLHCDQPLVVIGRYRGQEVPRITLRGRVAGQIYETTSPPASIRRHAGAVSLSVLWARRQIEMLSDELWEHPEQTASLRRQINVLAAKHGLCTQYTSLVSIEGHLIEEGAQGDTAAQALPELSVPRGSVSIIACPSCRSLVLPDTAQCPNCNFVFDEKRAAVEPPTTGHVEPTEEEIPCPGCNELVKRGLVRCWNCGTFMQSHIAETYKRMQISPPKVIYSEPDEDQHDAGAFSGSFEDASPPDAAATDEDFELNGQMVEDPDEGDFALGTAEPPATPNEIVQSAPDFALKEEEALPEAESKKSAAIRFSCSCGRNSKSPPKRLGQRCSARPAAPSLKYRRSRRTSIGRMFQPRAMHPSPMTKHRRRPLAARRDGPTTVSPWTRGSSSPKPRTSATMPTSKWLRTC